MELPLRNVQGEVAGSVEVSDALLGQPRNDALVHQALVMYQLNRRQGTHSTKVRGEVSGGGRKPWMQKHTGRARQGSIRAPQWRHGGIVFGPKPRDYRQEMPRRMRRQALRCVLSEKARSGKLLLVDELPLSTPRTRGMLEIVRALGVGGSAIIITREPQPGVVLSARNIQGLWTLPVRLLNAHELLKREAVIMTLDGLREAEKLWGGPDGRRRGLQLPGEQEEVPGEVAGDEVAPAASVEEEAEAISVAQKTEEAPRSRTRRTTRSRKEE